jgi:hypothetical protein
MLIFEKAITNEMVVEKNKQPKPMNLELATVAERICKMG